jgi:tRNA (guanosine-2'-O-)-methyltransferase
MTPARFARLKTILQRRQLDLSVVMDNVHKPHNLSAIMRTCDAVGVHHIHAVNPQEHLRPSKDITSGSGKWVNLHQHDNLTSTIELVKSQGMRVYAAHLSDKAVDFRTIDYTQPATILLGEELFGLSKAGQDLADEHIIIPMLGMIDSLNVSVAAALILFEAQRQRLASGLYEKQQIPDAEFKQTLFKWSHPKLAKFYNSKGLDFPDLDENGEVLETAAHIKARLNG